MIGRTLGSYEIVARLGVGGMGEVYRAHDARLRRDVAIKVLPAAVATDEDRLRRFEQEAHATAALNHPNILAVYDVGRGEDTVYVVTELLEGHTLREVIAHGVLPVRKVIHYATQIAAGLAAAHEKGIVHRDLKPDNLFVTTDERVKILDFGLAKVIEVPAGGASTMLAGGTEPGMVLGTLGYMAPEQVRGQAVDHRADIFSFGAILYELLTGRRAFVGDTAADTMTAILKEAPPDLATSGLVIPPALARVVDRCLEKNPAVRFQSASDLGFALQTLASEARSGSGIAPAISDLPAERRVRPWLVATATLALGALVATGVLLSLRSELRPGSLLELDIVPPLGHIAGETSALSPDGSRLVFTATATDASRRTQLWLRTMASGAIEPIEGTDDARNPFWSPDGGEIAFFAGGRLRAVELPRGRVRVIAEAPGLRAAGTWNQDGVILFASEAGVPIKRVKARGSDEPVPLESLGFRPHFLPDGRRYLFHSGIGAGRIKVADLESSEVVELTDGKDATYASGYVLFVRQQLLAQPFDLESLALTGEPEAVADIGAYPGSTGSNYSVGGGLVAFRRAIENDRQLVWYARDGARLGVVAGEGMWRNPNLSPDDARIAAERDEHQGTATDIWIVDVARGTSRALSAERGGEQTPVWSPDGARVIFSVARENEGRALVEKALDGGTATTGPATVGGTFTAVTPDGRRAIAFNIVSGNRDILIVPLDGTGPPVPFARSAFNETQPALSPDGRWLAYASDELGPNDTRDVFIQAFPGGGSKVHVTADTGGGLQPRWRRDGRELYFVALDGRLMAVPVDASSGSLRLGSAQALFQTGITGDAGGLGTRANYDATRDGRRFIVSEPVAAAIAREMPITVIVNWMTALATGSRPDGSPNGAR